MALDILISVSSFILTSLFVWIRRVFLLKLFRDTQRRFRLVWGHFWVAKSPKRIIRSARAAALRFCLQAIPASKVSARDIKRREIISAFSHYQNHADSVWIAALINAGEFMGGGDVMYSISDEGGTPAGIQFSKVELVPKIGHVDPTYWVHIQQDMTYWIDANKGWVQSDVVNADIHAIVEIPGLGEFIELLESVGMKKIEFSYILRQVAEVEQNYNAFVKLSAKYHTANKGKFALMKSKKVVALFDSHDEAYEAGKHKFPGGNFSIQEFGAALNVLGCLTYAAD